MISVGSRDGMKELGFGGQMKMEEETELEEGEACYYQEDEDGNFDPDVHLSYIDEKIQDILGHFQKDFEGGVSAENLGSKFGGYGSFLPTYQRSPTVLSHPRTPQKVQNYDLPRSPNNLPSKDTHQNAKVTSTRPGSASTNPLTSVSRAPALGNLSKRDVCLSSTQSTGEFTPKHKPVNKSVNQTNQKTLKVRIKVGPDTMLAQNNAAIYSGLGLDISPSSSLEDSPAESGGLSPESHDTLYASPMSILQNMTSFPVPGSSLLSPLSDSLLHLREQEKLPSDSRSGVPHKCSQDSSEKLVAESPCIRVSKKISGQKKKKSVEKKLIEVKNKNVNDVGSGSALLKKEINVKTPADRELIPNALKFPLTSNSKCNNDDRARGTGSGSDITREVDKCVVKEEIFSSYVKMEALESTAGHKVNNFEKQSSKTNLADSFSENTRTSSLKEVQFEPRIEGRSKDDKGYDPSGDRFDGYKGGKVLNDVPNNCPEHKAGNKTTYYEQYGLELPHGKEQSSTGAKKKSKGSRGKDIPPPTVFPKESSRASSSSSRKDKKKHSGNMPSKIKEKRLQKKSGAIDLFRNEKMELPEYKMDLLETPFKHAPKDSKLNVIEKEITTFSDKSKEMWKGKKVQNQAHSKVTPIVSPSTGNGPVSDAVLETVAPVVIQENWVCCDKCQKWRLLPYGHNPDELPKKWLCSMISWLPGMNRCNISEEETTKAFNALYQVLAPESQNSLNNLPHGAATGVALDGLQNVDKTHRDGDLHGMFSGGKKKLKTKEALYAVMHSDPTHFSNSTKGLLASVKSKSLHEANQMPLDSFQQLSKSSGIPVDKRGRKLKEKKKLLLDGGDTQLPKKSKRGIDQDGLSVSKKIKTGLDTEDWFPDHGLVMGKIDPNSISGVKNKTTGKDLQNYSEYSKDFKCDRKDKLPASIKKVSLNVGPVDPVKCDKVVIAVKKRKLQESHFDQPKTLTSTVNHLENNSISVKEETSESERRKEKKPRLSKSERKESSSSKGGDEADKRGRVTRILISSSRNPVPHGMGDNESDCITKDQQLGQYQQGNTLLRQSLDGTDILKKDFDYAQHSVAAASSSSKVSGSRKSKVNFHEVKGSPVESVSSSPLRISKPDKIMPARRKLLGKDDATNVGLNIMVSPRRWADGEVDGGNVPSGTIRMEKASSLVHRSSIFSSVLDNQHRDANYTSGDKAKTPMEPFSLNFDNTNSVNGKANDPDKHNPCVGGEAVPTERLNNHNSSNGTQHRKSGRGSSLRVKDKHSNSKSVYYGKGDGNVSSSLSEQELYRNKTLRYDAEIGSHNRSSYHEESKDEKTHFQDKSSAKSKKDEKHWSGKKDSVGKSSSDRKENQLNFGKLDCPDVNFGGTIGKDGSSSSQKTPLQGYESEKISNKFVLDTTGLETAHGKGKSQLFPNSGVKQERHSHCNRPKSGMLNASGSDILPVDASGGSGDAFKVSNQSEKLINQNGAHHNTSRHSTSNGIVVRDLGAPSPVRKDSSSQAFSANTIKEAKDLKHTADRLKSNGLELESTSIYFQAALKFLQGASILELGINESAKHGEISYMMEIYSSTAKLCEFVAREYEKIKDMASASLAYKCMEVAYMRIIYSRNSIVSKDRYELQAALQMLPPGESPSSSASDLDNNQGTVDKVALAKGVSSPQMTGNHVIVAQNHPNFVRLLNLAQNVNFAMEALRKSQNAFAAANADLGEARHSEGISSLKRVIDFTFYDVDGLLRLVRLAVEAISR